MYYNPPNIPNNMPLICPPIDRNNCMTIKGHLYIFFKLIVEEIFEKITYTVTFFYIASCNRALRLFAMSTLSNLQFNANYHQ